MSYLGKCTEGDRFVHDDGKCKGREVSKYNHYFKDVSNLNHIDVYRVIKLWGIEDPCQQHALKKVLCAGSRGAKNYEKDIQEAIDSLNRLLEMIGEDYHAGYAKENPNEASENTEGLQVKADAYKVRSEIIGADDEPEIPYIIIGDAPEWARWICCDKDNILTWFHENKPEALITTWGSDNGLVESRSPMNYEISWDRSLRRVYRSQEEADKANGKSAG